MKKGDRGGGGGVVGREWKRVMWEREQGAGEDEGGGRGREGGFGREMGVSLREEFAAGLGG